jgi:hypothetical protein
MVKKYYIAMKKKYQIPESENKFLRTSLICGSGNVNPTPGPGEGTAGDKPGEHSSGEDGAEARLRRSSNLMEL